MQAKAAAKTWKKPKLTPGQSALPVELWSLVLEQMLAEDPLWDLRATVQGLCHVSQTCRDLYMAVQQQGWSTLSQLLSPLPVPPQLIGLEAPADPEHTEPLEDEEAAAAAAAAAAKKASLPADLNVLVNDPASLRVPELKAACSYYGLAMSGQ